MAAGNTDIGSAEISEQSIVSKVAWRLMPIIMISYFFAFFDRINISFAKFQLQGDLGLSDTAYGLGASLFVIGYVVFEVPSNMLLYRVGARRWIARIMISWGLATSAMVLVHSEWQFYLVRFLIGAMEAGFAPGVIYYLTIWFPNVYRGRIISLLFLASAFSGLIGAPTAGFILGHLDGLAGIRGWHWLFIAGGVPSILMGFLVLRQLKDRIADAGFLTEPEKRLLSASIAQDGKHVGKGHSLWGAIVSPGFLMLALIYFIIQIASYGLNFWAPHLIRAAGTKDPTIIGLLTSVPYVFGAVAMLIAGRLSDRKGARTTYVVVLLLMSAVGFLMAGVFAAQPLLLVPALAIMGAGIIASIPSFWTLPPRLLVGAGAAGGIALINTLGQLGGIVSPVMVGWIVDTTGSTTPALYAIAGTCIVAAGLVGFCLPNGLTQKPLQSAAADLVTADGD